MAQVEEGDRVKISYICRLEDGTIYDFSERDSLEFIVGEGNLPPELEKGAPEPGHRTVPRRAKHQGPPDLRQPRQSLGFRSDRRPNPRLHAVLHAVVGENGSGGPCRQRV